MHREIKFFVQSRWGLLMSVELALAMFIAAEPSWAQTQGGKMTITASSSKRETAPSKLRAQLARATDDYKSNLRQLLLLYEAESKRAEERLTKVRELLAQGLVTWPEVQAAEDAAVQTREKVAEAQAQLKRADVLVAEAVVEAEAEESTRRVKSNSLPRAVNGLVQTTAYIRYGGARTWSLSDAAGIKQFFTRRFGRALPVGSFGQSLLHDRWGYDHRNAMDIAVSPDSAEGQALMEYLRANGVPFTAFQFALPGKAAGPHIHIGLPSHRIAPASPANAGNLLRM